MKRLPIIILLVVTATSSYAAEPLKTFLWIANSKNLSPIDLTAGHDEPDNITWSYAVDCSSQQPTGVSGSDNKLFSCTVDQDERELIIKLARDRAGAGTIAVTAIGRPLDDGQTQTETWTYKVQVIEKTSAQVEECPEWDCPLGHGLYLGVEGTSVSKTNSGSNIRLQYSAYSQIDHNIPLLPNVHMYGSLMQTSLQEQAALEEGCSSEEVTGCEMEATVGGRLGVFRPWNHDGGEYRDTIIIGPFVDYNVQKLDTSDRFISSYYGGLRFAYSKTRYFSIGYGKTEDIPGNRVNITGQLPLYNQKIVAGMTLNLAADGEAERSGVSPGDSINIYVITRVDFTNIFTNL